MRRRAPRLRQVNREGTRRRPGCLMREPLSMVDTRGPSCDSLSGTRWKRPQRCVGRFSSGIEGVEPSLTGRRRTVSRTHLAFCDITFTPLAGFQRPPSHPSSHHVVHLPSLADPSFSTRPRHPYRALGCISRRPFRQSVHGVVWRTLQFACRMGQRSRGDGHQGFTMA